GERVGGDVSRGEQLGVGECLLGEGVQLVVESAVGLDAGGVQSACLVGGGGCERAEVAAAGVAVALVLVFADHAAGQVGRFVEQVGPGRVDVAIGGGQGAAGEVFQDLGQAPFGGRHGRPELVVDAAHDGVAARP